jgi:hypothetical protein
MGVLREWYTTLQASERDYPLLDIRNEKRRRFDHQTHSLDSEFVSDTIAREIAAFTHTQVIKYNYRGHAICITIHFGKDGLDTTHTVQSLIICLNAIIAFIGARMPMRQPYIHLYWYQTHDKKQLSLATDRVLNPSHVNSGYTTFSSDRVYMVLFRVEECLKVLLHEFIHFSRYDTFVFPRVQQTKAHAAVYQRVKVHNHHNEYLLNESVTDALALYLYTAFYVYCVNHTHFTAYSGSTFPRLFAQAWKKQKAFSRFQAAKVLAIQGFKSVSELSSKTFYEDANVFSYYVVKSALVGMDKHLERVLDKSNPLRYDAPDFIEALTNKEFAKDVDANINRLVGNPTSINKRLRTTLRMSLM